MCIQQTTLDLLEKGYDVHILADGVSSRAQVDRMFALEVSVCSLVCIHTVISKDLFVYLCRG